MNQYKNLKLTSDQEILTVSLNRPQTLNAFSPELFDDLFALCDELVETEATQVVIFTGVGKGFSSGLDLNVFAQGAGQWTQADLSVLIRHWQETFNKIEALPQITIAAVNGVNGHHHHPSAPDQNEASENGSPRTAPTQPAPATKLEHALKTAISAAHNAEKYGTELGYVVRFDADAIKSMAITVLINMSEGGRR